MSKKQKKLTDDERKIVAELREQVGVVVTALSPKGKKTRQVVLTEEAVMTGPAFISSVVTAISKGYCIYIKHGKMNSDWSDEQIVEAFSWFDKRAIEAAISNVINKVATATDVETHVVDPSKVPAEARPLTEDMKRVLRSKGMPESLLEVAKYVPDDSDKKDDKKEGPEALHGYL